MVRISTRVEGWAAHDPAGGLDAVQDRHADVHEHHVGPEPPDGGDRVLAVAGLPGGRVGRQHADQPPHLGERAAADLLDDLQHLAGRAVLEHAPLGAGLSVVSQSGSYRIVRGTGQYAGISGHGTYQLSLEIVAARTSGRCSSARPPLGQQELLQLSGPVRR